MLSLNGLFQKSHIRLALHSKTFVGSLNLSTTSKMNVILPKIIMNGFPCLPRVTRQDCDLHDSKYQWFRQIKSGGSRKDNNYSPLIESFIYTPTIDDVGHHLRLVYQPFEGRKKGKKFVVDSKNPVQLSPSYFPFRERHKFTTDFLKDDKDFRVMSYNILADLYANSDYSRNVLFDYCPTHALSMDYRVLLIMKELVGYHADIMCLQEVDRKIYDNNLEPYLNHSNKFSGVFHRKGGHVSEGLATFYRDEKFELVHSHKTLLRHLIKHPKIHKSNETEMEGDIKILENHPILSNHESLICERLLDNFIDIRSAISSKSSLESRFCDRTTILQTNLFRFKKDPTCLVLVANTHLYSMPDADHIRLLQGSTCVKYLEFLINDFLEPYTQGNKIHVIFCGDMNSSPDCGLFQLVTSGEVCSDLPDWRSNENEAVEGLTVKTAMRLCSIYDDIEYTNYTPGFHGCLDYIYCHKEDIRVLQVVPPPYHEDVVSTGGIPSDVFPSDHIALVADLSLKKT